MPRRTRVSEKRGFGLLEIVLVLGIIGLIAGGGFYAKTLLKEQSDIQTGNNALEQAEQVQQTLDKQADAQVNQLNAIDQLMSPKVVSVVDTSTTAPSGVEGWKTYRSDEFGFEFKYPSDGLVEVDSYSGTRIQNYSSTIGGAGIVKGEYFIEISPTRYRDGLKRDCKKELPNGRRIFFGEKWVDVITGGSNDITGNDLAMLCTPDTYLQVNYSGNDIGSKVISSFKFTK